MVEQIVPVPSRFGTQTIVASTAAAGGVEILAANASRIGFSLWNDSTQILYLLLSDDVPTSTVWTLAMAAGSYFEDPWRYTGRVMGIWASANGNARITEFS